MARILVVLDELLPVRGAPQVRVHNLLAALPDWDRRAVGGGCGEVNSPEGFTLLERPSERRPIPFVLFLRRLSVLAARIARLERPDVVVVSVPKYEMLGVVPRLKKYGSTVVVDLRDSLAFLDYGAYLRHFLPGFVARPLGRFFSAINRRLQARALKAADIVTVANEGIKATVQHPCVVVVPNGVDTELFTPQAKRWFDRSRSLRLVYLGNFAEKDRFDWLQGLQGRTDVEIHLIGDGRNRERVVASLSGLNVVVHGSVPHNDLPALLATMDLGFIFRERGVDQSIPVCLFEYTSMNIPAVCNDTGIMAQFVRERGIGFVVNDIPDFVEVVDRLVAEPKELATFGGLHAIAERDFSLRASREIFRQLLGREQERRTVENGA